MRDAGADDAEATIDAAPMPELCGRIYCDCTSKSRLDARVVQLWGKVQYVTNKFQADFWVKEDNTFFDLRVKNDSPLVGSCGRWREVTTLPDFMVWRAPSIEPMYDFRIKIDNARPGFP